MSDNQVTYRVLVGDLGWVAQECTDYDTAKRDYDFYVEESKHNIHERGYQEQVTLWSSEEDDPIEWYEPETDDDDMPYCYDCHDFINVEPTIAYRIEYNIPLCDICFEKRQDADGQGTVDDSQENERWERI